MESLRKLRSFLKDKFRVRKPQRSFIEFAHFFWSENFFKFFGFNILPTFSVDDGKKWKKVAYVTAIVSLLLLLILMLISMPIGVTKSDSVVTLSENWCALLGLVVIFVKVYSLLYLHRGKIEEIVATLDFYYPHDFLDQQLFNVSGHIRILKILGKLGVVLYVLGFVMFNFIPIISQTYWYFSSQTVKFEPIYHLYTPFDQNNPLCYIVLNIIAMLSHSSGLVFIFMTDLLYAELVALTAMELNILGHMMSEIDPEDDQEKALEDFKKLVKVHEDLIEVTEKLQEIFSLILFMDLFGIIGMCTSLAFLAFVSDTKYFLIVIVT